LGLLPTILEMPPGFWAVMIGIVPGMGLFWMTLNGLQEDIQRAKTDAAVGRWNKVRWIIAGMTFAMVLAIVLPIVLVLAPVAPAGAPDP
jgi:hypothetical protein